MNLYFCVTLHEYHVMIDTLYYINGILLTNNGILEMCLINGT